MLLGNGALHGSGKLSLHILDRPGRVEKEYAAVLETFENIVLGDIACVVACYEVSAVDEVGALDGGLAEAEVADGQTAGLLGVICEITLSEHVGVVADDLDAVLVGTYGTVAAKAEELAADGACGSSIDEFVHGDGGVHNIVDDADGEMILGLCKCEVVIDCLDHGGGEFLAAKTITAAVALDIAAACFGKSVNYIEVERFAEGTGLLSPVEHCDLLAGCGDSSDELVGCEGPVKANFDETKLLALGVEIIDGFFGNIRAAAHDNDNTLCIGCADIVKEMIPASGQLANLVHVMLNDLGNLGVVDIGSLTTLEVDVGVLSGTGLMGMLRIESTVTECLDCIAVKQLCHILVVDLLDLLDLMGGTEAVEEVYEGKACLDGGKMSYKCKIHNFLYGSGSEHCKTGLAACHNVAVVSEDGEGVSGERASGNVEDTGKQFAGDLIHIGDHQKKTLRSGESGGESAC